MQRKTIILLLFCIFLEGYVQAQVFQSDANLDKKPWTNLNFKNDPNNFQFIILSDRNGGSRPGVFEDAIQKINLMQPEFVLSVGDLIAGYTTDTASIARQWKEVNGMISKLQMPFFYLPGNHDITNKIMEKEWEKRYGNRYYSFNYKNTLFIVLDSNDDDDYNLTREQTDFMLKTLKDSEQARWTFILMHHPIWTYDTHGRFEEIETALKDRKYTVIAGHEHHYHQAERNGRNYYILSTTGAGSALRGTYFGEFDHIAWMTMTDNGPIMVNLRLDGILPHDVSNEQTEKMAQPLIQNARLNHVLLCNSGAQFKNGTLYLSLKNPTDSKLLIDINFFHHHQLQIKTPSVKMVVEPGKENFVEVELQTSKPMDYTSLDLLMFDWQIRYDNPQYKGFGLEGKNQMEVKPTMPHFIDKETDVFVNQLTVPYKNPFSNIETTVSIDHGAFGAYTQPIQISKSGEVAFILKNKRDEYTSPEARTFVKTDFQEAANVKKLTNGLNYLYFEGEWTGFPDLRKLKAKTGGVAGNLLVTELAKQPDNWGVLYAGYLNAGTDNLYMFRLKSSNACRVFIDGKMVIDDKKQAKGENIGVAALKRGYHPIRIEFWKKTGDARLRLYMKMEGEEDWKELDSGPFFH